MGWRGEQQLPTLHALQNHGGTTPLETDLISQGLGLDASVNTYSQAKIAGPGYGGVAELQAINT